ncbi:response regulator [Celeribacter sp.]|uniref:response regulator n=1 Tax=Celeribacter sp. TaxID=1890673 RepID=UPI003A946E78
MSTTTTAPTLSETVASLLPYLRQYARALCGNQDSGDAYVAAMLEALLSDRSAFEKASSPRVAVFQAFHAIWISSGAPAGAEDTGIAARAQAHLTQLTPNTREVLLLRTIAGFSREEVAEIVALPLEDVEALYTRALRDMEDSVAGKVMVIEDEAIIALDIQSIVSEMGHYVTGVAPTAKAAVALFEKEMPDLILSDIQLADGSSGIDAVNDILKAAGDVPVIFITAFPERLLTGERPEPAFVIPKPYTEQQVKSAVSQAMFFASTQTLTV